ncbi:MAG TPA: NAD(P)H-hydrate dehydratase [Phycisphaerales bacterium]|nr:NAD(P)H-hydrate dehydratase [Phycisphaerales bacterium]
MEQVTDVPKLASRATDAHKGTFGKVLIVGGSVGMSGAVALAGKAALRSGAGLVRIATPQSVLPIVAAIDPCYTTIPLAVDDDGCIASAAIATVLDQITQNDVTAFGPGIGQSRGVRDVLNVLIAQPDLRLIIDADGLNCLAKDPDWVERKTASVILTPHPGEMKRLWSSLFREPIPGDRTAQAQMLAKACNCTVILKGAGTVVTNGEKFYINTTGNPGMATAGSGDVLTGIIAAFVAQGMTDLHAAIAATYTHGLAGDIAAKKIGQVSLIVTDIIHSLRKAFKL